MAKHRLLETAQQDLEDILYYVGQDNMAASRKLRKAFMDACAKLAEYPYMGHTRADLTDKPVRFWSVSSYMIIYDPQTAPLQILRILSGYRDITSML